MSGKSFDRHIQEILIPTQTIQERIQDAGAQISRIYADKPLLLVGILNGAFVFMADLCRSISIPCETAFMRVRSYSGMSSQGNPVEILMDLEQDISRYHVLIAEDILDTGRTLRAVTEILKERHPLSLRVVTLLDKPSRRAVDFEADMSLFTIADRFVVGYGLDYNGSYRNLPYVAVYTP